jgi:opacity protein-like surface antigen
MKMSLQMSITILILVYGEMKKVYSQSALTNFELGGSIGTFIYQGDLTPSHTGSIKTQKPGFNLFANKILNSSFSVRTNLAIDKLKGDDAKYSNPDYRQQRNFNFTSPVVEISEQLLWNPLRKNYDNKGFAPYLFAGVGFSFLKSKRDWSKFNGEYFADALEVLNGLSEDIQHSLPEGIAVVPVGIGFRYALSPKISISAEISYRFSFTDYLDGFSQAADPNKRDNYYSNSIGIIYRFGIKNKLDCPVIRN